MTRSKFILLAVLLCLPLALTAADKRLKLSVAEYQDKVYASWLGQCIGNIYGLPHENKYITDPGPETFPYGYKEQRRMRDANGAFSDDDTDVEYMYLLAMEKFGPEPRYRQLSRLWSYHIRDRVWLANRAALAAMHHGYTPPFTGRKELNPHWFQIDPQLVNEIWAVTAPGMIRYAAEKSLWAARITDDDWAVEPTVHYGAMYAAAFFEQDIGKLVDLGTRSLPDGSRFARTVEDMKALYRKYPNDWKQARREMAEKYFTQEPVDTKTIWNANLNGAAGILALLYGRGDFQRTLDLACAIGFDADNQAATMSGLLGVVLGTKGLPHDLLYPFPELNWKEPLNDVYKNVSRHDMPDASLKDMAARMARQGEKIILMHGGKKISENGQEYFLINSDAAFMPPLEIAAGPAPIIEAGRPVNYRLLAVGGRGPLSWRLSGGALPEGLSFRAGVLTGKTSSVGIYPITVAVKSVNEEDESTMTLVVRSANIAGAASEILVPLLEAAEERLGATSPSVDRSILTADPEALRDGRTHGPGSAFLGVARPSDPNRHFFGYRWRAVQEIGLISFHTGLMEDGGGWFRTLQVEYEDESGAWRPVERWIVSPSLPGGDRPFDKPHQAEYLVAFPQVRTKAIRIAGEPPAGRRSRHISIAELRVYGALPHYSRLPR